METRKRKTEKNAMEDLSLAFIDWAELDNGYPDSLELEIEKRHYSRSVSQVPNYLGLEFNRKSKDKIVPHLIKSNFIPENQKVFNSDIVKRGQLPLRKVAPIIASGTNQLKNAPGHPPLSRVSNKLSNQRGFNNQDKLDKLNAFLGQPSDEYKIPPQKQNNSPSKNPISKDFAPKLNQKREENKSAAFKNLYFEKSGINTKSEPERVLKKRILIEKNDFIDRFIPKFLLRFSGAAISTLAIMFLLIFTSYAFQFKNKLDSQKKDIVTKVKGVKTAIGQNDFENLDSSFSELDASLNNLQRELDLMGGDTLNLFSSLPFLSRVGSAKNLVDAGNHLMDGTKKIIPIVTQLHDTKNLGSQEGSTNYSLTETFLSTREQLLLAKEDIDQAVASFDRVKIEDLPAEHRQKFNLIKEGLPNVVKMIDVIDSNTQIFLELLGHNGPRKYLLLFQNNQEMRATGGFIGSYGLLEINAGKIDNFKIEGIYNPDGQLTENIIPPEPIQKISAGWSTHDANWFPHFPTSAQKVAWFYEKTGGPTIDGVIALTPDVLQKLLEVIGPVELTDNEKIITAENFNLEIRQSVEKVNEANQEKENQLKTQNTSDKKPPEIKDPKSVLAQLAPLVLNRVLEVREPARIAQLAKSINDSLVEKHLIFYSINEQIQTLINQRNWGGEILDTKGDYLMIVNSNINGFKTDGVIDQKVEHETSIQADGTVVAELKITRVHNGGNTGYSEWDKVNANYMRVYVPRGSKLVSVDGHVREFTEPPVNYLKLGFQPDADVEKQESAMIIDFKSGTRIYEEEGKTVFANWNYVSPGETTKITYKYQLPFKLDFKKDKSYSIFYQKQSGSNNCTLNSSLKLPKELRLAWKKPENTKLDKNKISLETSLIKDQFLGVVFE